MKTVRQIGYEILDKIYVNRSFSNIELNNALNENNLSNLDKDFLTRLVYGTLKDTILLDYEIDKVNKVKEIKHGVKTILRMSLYQLREMDKVPDYAIINEAVEITKNEHGLLASKFINATLHTLASKTFYPSITDFKDEMEYYSIMSSVPYWICKMVQAHHGKEIAMDYINSYKLVAPISLRINTLKSNKDELLKKSYFEESKLSIDGLIYKGNKPMNCLKEFLDGKVMIQGESSQLVGRFLNPSKDDNILDMCAAPGGKTYHLSALMENGGQITSVDLYEHRIKLLVSNLPRLGIKNVNAIAYDSTKLDDKFEKESFDKILLDAPCSGLGVARRKPDIFLNLRPNDIDTLVKLQQDLIDQAYKLLKKGGCLVYSTCTIDKKENEKQIDYILDKYKDMKLVDSKSLYPSTDIIDGFFMAKLIKD